MIAGNRSWYDDGTSGAGSRPDFRIRTGGGMMVCGIPNRAVITIAAVAMALGGLGGAARDDGDALPRELAPFESLVGGWKGTGQPLANRIRGWPERHVWAWKFSKGKPVAVTLNWEGDKLLGKGTITPDPASGGYKLVGADPDGKPVVYAGQFDESGRQLVLSPTAEVAGDPRLTIRVNENGIRYTVWIDRKENGAPRARREIEVGLTREGESFAAGGAAGQSGPKCVVTGGTATLSVTYEGKTYPLCCTGCREEFNENPEKYVARAAAAMARSGDSPNPAPAPATTSAPNREPKPAPEPKPEPEKAPAKPAAPKPSEKSATAARAASWLRLGQALEKAGKKSSAVEYYKRILEEASDAPEAKSAAARLKDLGEK